MAQHEAPDPNATLALGIIEAARAAGVGRSTVFDEINAGRLKARKAGRRTLILREDLQAWLAALPTRVAPSQRLGSDRQKAA